MRANIYIHYRRAVQEALTEAQLTYEDLTDDERQPFTTMMNTDVAYLVGFSLFIMEHSKANGGKLGDCFKRAVAWVNRYQAVLDRATLLAGLTKRGKWLLGQTEQHCRTCAGLHGRVYRYSVWLANGVWPKSARLECGPGNRCQCQIVPVQERITPGPFPKGLLV